MLKYVALAGIYISHTAGVSLTVRKISTRGEEVKVRSQRGKFPSQAKFDGIGNLPEGNTIPRGRL